MRFYQRIKTIPGLAFGLSLLGVFYYTLQAWRFIHTQMSVVDEGNYLYKGLLFVRGQYEIYQDYGPWSNHMPLSFLIPGAILNWFGPSLQTARFLALALGLLLLCAIWVIAKRWGGSWWAAFAVWSMALNPAVIKIYSQMTSEVLIACMLAWVLVLVLGEKRSLASLLLGSIFVGLILLTRENMIALWPMFILYIGWQHGWRSALWASLVLGITVLIGFAVFWPGILRVWAAWIPAGWVPFLQTYSAPEATALWNPQIGLARRLMSLFWALRFHFVATMGVLVTLLLWPRKSAWKSDSQHRASVFLTTLFVVLAGLHGYVTVGQGIASNKAYSTSYCTFCLPIYFGFFSFTGILLIVIASPSWRKELSIWLQGLISLLIIGITSGIGYASFETLGDSLASWQFPGFMHRWLRPNTLRLWKYLNYHYAISYYQSKRLLPTLAGSLRGIGVLLISGGIYTWFRIKKKDSAISFGYIALVVLLGTGWLLVPTQALGGGYHNYDCESDVLATYAALGTELQELLPPGATVYWQGEPASTVLVYLPEIRIFPPQLNQKFSFFEGDDADALAKYGFWNQELARQWLSEADYALVGTFYRNENPASDLDPQIDETDFYNAAWLVTGLAPENGYQLLDQVQLPMPCQPNQMIRVYQRQP